jgi:hypothetical protein
MIFDRILSDITFENGWGDRFPIDVVIEMFKNDGLAVKSRCQ